MMWQCFPSCRSGWTGNAAPRPLDATGTGAGAPARSIGTVGEMYGRGDYSAEAMG